MEVAFGLSLPIVIVLAVAVLASFFVSSSAGLGGSLVLIPSLALFLGPKEAVVLGALLLGLNNVVKVAAYRQSLPFRAAGVVVALLMVGSFIGASALVRAPERLVGFGVLASFAMSLVAERRDWLKVRRVAGPLLAFGAGATSGFTGTSGPLKGAALRNLPLDRAHLVGGASLASLAGDATKSLVFAQSGALSGDTARIALVCIPLMFAGTLFGRRFNRSLSENGYSWFFWSVMGGYSVRVALTLL